MSVSGHAGQLSESCFLTIAAALEAFDSGPDPTTGPVKARSTSERRADALDDLAHFGLTRNPDGASDDPPPDVAEQPDDASRGDDSRCTFARPNRAHRRARQRRLRRKSAATVNVIIDLLTRSGRDASDLSGIEWTGRPRGHTPRPRHREPAPA